jgi:hypothetical protein
MLNTRDLIPGCTVIFGEFRFDDHLRIKLARDNKVGCLIKAFEPLRPFCLSKTDTRSREQILYGRLQAVPDNLTDRIPVAGKRSSQKPLLEQHRIGDSHCGHIFNCLDTTFGVCLIEAMNFIRLNFWCTLGEQLACRFDEGF